MSDQTAARPPEDPSDALLNTTPVHSDANPNSSPPIRVHINPTIEFPVHSWTSLKNCLNLVKWVVPVLPDSDLEKCLKAAIEMAKCDQDMANESCVKFYKSALIFSFNKTFQDDAVRSWECQILQHSTNPDDLSWEIEHGVKSNSVVRYTHLTPLLPHLLADSPTQQQHVGSNQSAQLKDQSLRDIIVPHLIQTRVDEPLVKIKDGQIENNKNDSFTDVLLNLRGLLSCIPERQILLEEVDIFCLKVIYSNLHTSSFNKRMTALNDLDSFLYRLSSMSKELGVSSSPTMDRVAKWMEENQVLDLVLREHLHQPQYVKRVEQIYRFMMKHDYLTPDDLDRIWSAQLGKHEAIVQNVFNMLAKLALDLSPAELDHLFGKIQASWADATRREREQLISLIAGLAKESQQEPIAKRVIRLLWDFAIDPTCSTEIKDLALSSHASTLYVYPSNEWLKHLNDIIQRGPLQPLLLTAIKQIIGYYKLFPTEQAQQGTYRYVNLRMEQIKLLVHEYNIFNLSVSNVVEAMRFIREDRAAQRPARIGYAEVNQLLELVRFLWVEGSLPFPLRSMKTLWSALLVNQNNAAAAATESVTSTAGVSQSLVSAADRDVAFRWFASLPLDMFQINDSAQFLEENVLRVNPSHMTETGMTLFLSFFYQVNSSIGQLVCTNFDGDRASAVTFVEPTTAASLPQPRWYYRAISVKLRGLDYMWCLLLDAPSLVASQARDRLRELYSSASPRGTSAAAFPTRAAADGMEKELLEHCFSLLRVNCDTVEVLLNNKPTSTTAEVNKTVERMTRVIQLLRQDLMNPRSEAWELPLKSAWIGPAILFKVNFHTNSPSSGETTSAAAMYNSPPTTTSTASNSNLRAPTTNPPLHVPDSICFAAHANMTIGQLRSHLLSHWLNHNAAVRAHAQGHAGDQIMHDDVSQTSYQVDLCTSTSTIGTAGRIQIPSPSSGDYFVEESLDDKSVFSLVPFYSNMSTWEEEEQVSLRPNSDPVQLNLIASLVYSTKVPRRNESERNSRPQSIAIDRTRSTSLTTTTVLIDKRSPRPHSSSLDGSQPKAGLPSDDLVFEPAGFLLRLMELAIKLDNSTLLTGGLNLLLSLPAMDSLVNSLTQNIVPRPVPGTDSASLQGSELHQLLTDPSGPKQLSKLLYTLHVLYSMCMPTAAVSEWHDLLSCNKDEILRSLQSGDLSRSPLWYTASRFTLHLLRAGFIPLLLSCPILSSHHSTAATTTSSASGAHSFVVDQILVWLTRFLTLLSTVSAFTSARLKWTPEDKHCTSGGGGGMSAGHCRPLCQLLKTMASSGNPTQSDVFFLATHADWVAHMAILEKVTVTEFRNIWIPQSASGLDKLLQLINRCAMDAETPTTTNLIVKALGDTEEPSAIGDRPREQYTTTFGDSIISGNSSFSADTEHSQCPTTSSINSPNKSRYQWINNNLCDNPACTVAVQALSCLPIFVTLSQGESLTDKTPQLAASPDWLHQWTHDWLFSRPRHLRQAAAHNLYILGSSSPVEMLVKLIHILFELLPNHVPDRVDRSENYFHLLSMLLGQIHTRAIPLKEATAYLRDEIDWLQTHVHFRKVVPHQIESTPPGTTDTTTVKADATASIPLAPSRDVLDPLLAGHARICSGLLSFQHSLSEPLETDQTMEKSLSRLVQDITQYILFPTSDSSSSSINLDSSTMLTGAGGASCRLPETLLTALLDFLIAFARFSPSFMRQLSQLFVKNAFPSHVELSSYSWDYTPPALCNTTSANSSSFDSGDHFVGLRNGGATCYMNAILQQLFTLHPVRNAVLRARPDLRLAQSAQDLVETGEPSQISADSAALPQSSPQTPTIPQTLVDGKTDTKNKALSTDHIHQLKVLAQLQSIFGHLSHSFLRYYRPFEFWQEFRLTSSQPLRTSEQQDALEFFHTLADDVDESLHLCGQPKAIENIFGGTFADEKVCIDCPHRYSRTESFNTLNVAIRNHRNLLESLEEFVKEDRLEGDNAYRCEACDKKVTTLKRMYIDRLPLVLTIQLKRFDYDFDELRPVKCNDYFEFPRELDMLPYTVQGLNSLSDEDGDKHPSDPKKDGNPVTTSSTTPITEDSRQPKPMTRYTLRGVVVHSGQATAGHYYSFIRCQSPSSGQFQWYRFDDTEVTLSRMHEEEEAKSAWFGRDDEQDNDSYEQSSKRYMRKHYWSAYVLFYQREDFEHLASLPSNQDVVITPCLKELVIRENLDFLKQQVQFNPILSKFMTNLAETSLIMAEKLSVTADNVIRDSLQLLINYVLCVRFQPLSRDWFRWIRLVFKLVCSRPNLYEWFIHQTLFDSSDRWCELLLECPFVEVRFLFYALIFYIARSPQSSSPATICLKALQQDVSSATETKPLPSGTSLTTSGNSSVLAQTTEFNAIARVASSREILRQLSPDASPSLCDLLLQTMILQLSSSPAEFVRQDAAKLSMSTASSSSSVLVGDGNLACGSSGSRFTKSITLHPLVWNQYFSMFLDYANTSLDARRRLLRLGLLDVLLKYAVRIPLVHSTYSYTQFQQPTVTPPVKRSKEYLKTQLDQLVQCMGEENNNNFIFSTSIEAALLVMTYDNPYGTTSTFTPGSASHQKKFLPTSYKTDPQYAAQYNLWYLISLLLRSLDMTEPPKSTQQPPVSSSTQPAPTDPIGSRLSSATRNPYASCAQPVMPCTQTLFDIMYRMNATGSSGGGGTSGNSGSIYEIQSNSGIAVLIKPSTLNVVTRDIFVDILMFLCFDNAGFTITCLNVLVSAYKREIIEATIVLPVLQAILSVDDSHKVERIYHVLNAPERYSLALPVPPENDHRINSYIGVIEMFMDVAMESAEIQEFFQSEEKLIDWLRGAEDRQRDHSEDSGGSYDSESGAFNSGSSHYEDLEEMPVEKRNK